MNWTPDHDRLFARLEEVDPVTPQGRRRQALREQVRLATWAREAKREQEQDKRREFGWDRIFGKGWRQA